MERKDFLIKCRDVALLKSDVRGIKKRVPDGLKVCFDGITYYPLGVKLTFDSSGAPINTAVLHSLKADSISFAPLEKVGEHSGK